MAALRNTSLNLHRRRGEPNIAEACRTTGFMPDRGIHLLTEPENSRSNAC
jgi:hypothetical protein